MWVMLPKDDLWRGVDLDKPEAGHRKSHLKGFRPSVSNSRSAGQIWPASSFYLTSESVPDESQKDLDLAPRTLSLTRVLSRTIWRLSLGWHLVDVGWTITQIWLSDRMWSGWWGQAAQGRSSCLVPYMAAGNGEGIYSVCFLSCRDGWPLYLSTFYGNNVLVLEWLHWSGGDEQQQRRWASVAQWNPQSWEFLEPLARSGATAVRW